MKNRIIGSSVIFLSAFSAFIIVAIILLMLYIIYSGGSNLLSLSFLLDSPKDGMTSGGIFPAIVGTSLLVIIMTIAGVPVGTITAIYLHEYASQKSIFTRMIRFAVNTLAGIPGIVFGLFGFGFFIQFVGVGIDKNLGVETVRWALPNILWASLTMALLTLPVVIVSVEEALRNVPKEYRAASLALGATKFTTIIKVVLPNAISGIFTGSILAVGRGAGEVAPILFTGAAYFLPQIPQSLSDQFMHVGYHLYIMTTQSADVEATKQIQFASAFVLLLLTFILNFSAILLRQRMQKKLVS